MRKPSYYIGLRNRFLPKKIKMIFVPESPPASGKFFYDPAGNVTEPLFSAFMNALKIKPQCKEEGLELFKRKGYFLIDPIYVPVNRKPDKKADKLIWKNFPRLKKELSKYATRKTPIVIVKTTVFRLLSKPLIDAGFNVINRGPIPFPVRQHRKRFANEIRKLI